MKNEDIDGSWSNQEPRRKLSIASVANERDGGIRGPGERERGESVLGLSVEHRWSSFYLRNIYIANQNGARKKMAKLVGHIKIERLFSAGHRLVKYIETVTGEADR